MNGIDAVVLATEMIFAVEAGFMPQNQVNTLVYHAAIENGF
jgi:hypothetical protein